MNHDLVNGQLFVIFQGRLRDAASWVSSFHYLISKRTVKLFLKAALMEKDRDITLEIRKFVAPEFIFGWGAIDLAGQYAANYRARKVLLVTDPGVRSAGWSEKVEISLTASQIDFTVFDGVTSNPKDYEVAAGAELYLRKSCDVIVAIGGGSPMDCAKGIAITVANGGSVLDYEGVDKVSIPPPPMVFIPTTAGTAADVSQFAIVSDTARMIKIAIISKTIIPDIALIDPQTTLTKPQGLTAAVGMDVLTHAIEANLRFQCKLTSYGRSCIRGDQHRGKISSASY